MEQFPRSPAVSKTDSQLNHASRPTKTRKRLRSSVQPTAGYNTGKSPPSHRYGTRLRTGAPSHGPRPWMTANSPVRHRSPPSSALLSGIETAEQSTLPSPVACGSPSVFQLGHKKEILKSSHLEEVTTHRVGDHSAGQSARARTRDNRESGCSAPRSVSETCTSNSRLANNSGIVWLPQCSSSKNYSRWRSRLSIKRRPLPSNRDAPGYTSDGRATPTLLAGSHSCGFSNQGQHEMRGRPQQVNSKASLEIQHTSRSSAGSSASLLATSDRNTRNMESSSGEHSPPFVGLKNLGNSCYVNAVLQALLACPGFLTSLRDRSGVHVPQGDREQQIPCSSVEGVDCCSPKTGSEKSMVTAQQAVSTVGGSSKTVVSEITRLLHQMNARNTELALSSGMRDGKTSVETKAQKLTAEALDTTSSNRTEQRPLSRTPSNHNDAPHQADLSIRALDPSSVVELIRGGCLEESQAEESMHVGGDSPRVFGEEKSCEFVRGQQCASELLDRLLGLESGIINAGMDPDDHDVKRRKPGESSTCREGKKLLGADFQGVLCVRTRCVECERESVKRELFVELVVPPFVARPMLRGSNASNEGEEDGAAKVRRTLQELVESVLGSESLEGANKIWCKHCHQWTEADRRTSLHSPPRILVLHVRPAIQDSCIGVASVTSECSYMKQGTPLGYGPSLLGAGFDANVLHDAVVQRRLTVNPTLRCRENDEFARKTRSGDPSGSTGCDEVGEDTTVSVEDSSRSQSSEEISFDLIGVILHRGHTVDSGHYTFALRARQPGPKGLEVDPATSSGQWDSLAIGGGRMAACFEDADARHSGNVGAPATSFGSGAAGSRFVLFDDEHVRWLSAGEENAVFAGGGSDGDLGDVFLVFYVIDSRRAHPLPLLPRDSSKA